MSTKLKAERDEFLSLLRKIAHGNPKAKGSKPFPGTDVQQIARSALVRRGIHWSPSMLEGEEK